MVKAPIFQGAIKLRNALDCQAKILEAVIDRRQCGVRRHNIHKIWIVHCCQGLQAEIAHKKEAFLQLSGDQYQRIASLHPDPNKPAFVSLKLQVARVGTLKVDLVASCGVPDAR
jgi:hypothetical protein